MQIISALFISLLATVAQAGRDYEARAMSKLVVNQFCDNDCGGWSPLPPKASASQCGLALERIVRQPQTCAQKYMSGPARNVYLPIYNWFLPSADAVALAQVAAQFVSNNAVGIEIYDAFGRELVRINPDGTVLDVEVETTSFELARTWPLNYPTFLREEKKGKASITQNVWSADGQILTIVIFKEISLLPVVC